MAEIPSPSQARAQNPAKPNPGKKQSAAPREYSEMVDEIVALRETCLKGINNFRGVALAVEVGDAAKDVRQFVAEEFRQAGWKVKELFSDGSRFLRFSEDKSGGEEELQ